jgi:hypothetical protein
MNIFDRVFKNQTSTFCIRADGFSQFFADLLYRKFKIKFLLAPTKSLTNSENPSSVVTLFRKLVLAFR